MNEKTEERPESRTQTAGTENKERKRADPQRQAQKRTAVAALLMLIPFCAFMYLIFGDTDAGEEPGTGGINTTIPDGKVQRIEASRQKAAEKVEAEALAGEKIQSLGEAVSLPEPDSALRITTSLPAGGIDRSQDAHREMARQIESFYSDPAPAPRTEDLERELERLRRVGRERGGREPCPSRSDGTGRKAVRFGYEVFRDARKGADGNAGGKRLPGSGHESAASPESDRIDAGPSFGGFRGRRREHPAA